MGATMPQSASSDRVSADDGRVVHEEGVRSDQPYGFSTCHGTSTHTYPNMGTNQQQMPGPSWPQQAYQVPLAAGPNCVCPTGFSPLLLVSDMQKLDCALLLTVEVQNGVGLVREAQFWRMS
eukprot:TRINITY_DN3533_c0_g1_i12.p3 TRINITY_DN3533_c0_g1~~TRINITY_DN3533_c0_g1_i12.p3  ORF type:complete len:121 (+),score=11.66 TRINITY_DN3533_c0_g1_i12:479-841(+)